METISPRPVQFVCVAIGDLYGMAESYVNALYQMLTRHTGRPFVLACVTDRRRTLANDIVQIDCTNWNELRARGGRATRIKLGLFNPQYVQSEDFIYLDLSVVVRASLAPLLDFAAESSAPLVIVKDWYYDGYNSSVMRIRNRSLNFIYEEFVAGVSYPGKIPGDQDFITGSVRAHGTAVDCWQADQVVSFKHAIRRGLSDPAGSRAEINDALIVKFHGRPKMHHVFNPVYRFFKYGLRYLARGQLRYPFDITELGRNWRKPATQRAQ